MACFVVVIVIILTRRSLTASARDTHDAPYVKIPIVFFFKYQMFIEEALSAYETKATTKPRTLKQWPPIDFKNIYIML